MKTLVKYAYILYAIIFIIYLLLPINYFPDAPPDSLQSMEPADTESPLRKAYFTNLTRDEVLKHYQSQFEKRPYFDNTVVTFRVNYPPEEAQTIIRDQTRSTFLEEIINPFRESFFVNGFKPSVEKDAILISERIWLQKITVKYVPSNTFSRLIIGLATIIFIKIVYVNYQKSLNDFTKTLKKIWIYR